MIVLILRMGEVPQRVSECLAIQALCTPGYRVSTYVNKPEHDRSARGQMGLESSLTHRPRSCLVIPMLRSHASAAWPACDHRCAQDTALPAASIWRSYETSRQVVAQLHDMLVLKGLVVNRKRTYGISLVFPLIRLPAASIHEPTSSAIAVRPSPCSLSDCQVEKRSA